MTESIFMYLAFFISASISSMIGIGGGVLYVPILLAFGFPFYQAAAISIFIIIALSISATLVYYRNQLIDWKLALIIEPLTAIMSLMAGYYSSFIQVKELKILFILVLIVSGYFMLKPIKEIQDKFINHRKWGYWQRKFGEEEYSVNLIIGLPLTAMAGLMAGLLGIGGGIIKVPLMVLLLGVPMKIAVGTSCFMVGLTALFGFWGHFFAGHFEPKMALILAIVVFAGAQTGSRISIKVDKILLKKIYAIFLFLISAWMMMNVVK
ncbi:MAG: sulfite exporter TauE/SafE family protein [Candidatus Caldatribacteriota bacterium]|nr:sulfite exporter TauE/SafE family protein [Candidatus Caldatribacteriota bacterium]